MSSNLFLIWNLVILVRLFCSSYLNPFPLRSLFKDKDIRYRYFFSFEGFLSALLGFPYSLFAVSESVLFDEARY